MNRRARINLRGLGTQFLTAGLAVLLLAACGKMPEPATIPTGTYIQPTATAFATPRSTVTPFTIPTERPRPLPNPGESFLPTGTPVLIPARYDLPDWMKDPTAPILMQEMDHGSKTSQTLSFLNARTGEWFELPFPANVPYYFWFDATHFGFLSDDLLTIWLFDLNTGEGSAFPVPAGSTDLLGGSSYGIDALKVRRVPSSPEAYYFLRSYEQGLGSLSAYAHYEANMDRDTPGNPITITDRRSGEVLWRSSLTDGLWESDYAWSPVNDKYIAIVRGTPENETSSLVTKNTFLQVIDVKTGEVKAELKDDIGNILWSPDGSRILYEDASSRYALLGNAHLGSPCIFDIRTSQQRCLTRIPTSHIPIGYTLSTTGLYSWKGDGFSIRYMALYYNQNIGIHIGNICTYNLVDGTITCPTEGLSEPHGWGIGNYNFSPDDHFVNFCYSETDINNDFVGNGYDTLLQLSTGILLTWQNFSASYSQCSYSKQTWRPLP